MRYHVARSFRGIDGRLHREAGTHIRGSLDDAIRYAVEWAERLAGIDSGHIAIRRGNWRGPVAAEVRYTPRPRVAIFRRPPTVPAPEMGRA